MILLRRPGPQELRSRLPGTSGGGLPSRTLPTAQRGSQPRKLRTPYLLTSASTATNVLPNTSEQAPSKGFPAMRTEWFTEGLEAHMRGEHSAPALNVKVRSALTGLPVGAPLARTILSDFSSGWHAANVAAIAFDIDEDRFGPQD